MEIAFKDENLRSIADTSDHVYNNLSISLLDAGIYFLGLPAVVLDHVITRLYIVT